MRGAKLTIEQMHALAQEKNGVCLSTKYVSAKTKLRWRCSAVEGLGNVVVPVLGDQHTTGLPASSIDLALVCNVYNHTVARRTACMTSGGKP
jgi:hypothetical protein